MTQTIICSCVNTLIITIRSGCMYFSDIINISIIVIGLNTNINGITNNNIDTNTDITKYLMNIIITNTISSSINVDISHNTNIIYIRNFEY